MLNVLKENPSKVGFEIWPIIFLHTLCVFGIKVMLALYNELEEIIPLFLFSELVKGQHYLRLEGLAELTLETTM